LAFTLRHIGAAIHRVMAAGGKQAKLDSWRDQANGPVRQQPVIPPLPKLAVAPPLRRQLPEPAKRSASPVRQDRRPEQRSTPERGRDQAANSPAKGFSREETLDWILKARKEALAIRLDTAKAAEARIAELEASLEAALERVTYLGSENQALETSLDMAADENFDLGQRLADSEARNEAALAELQSAAVQFADHETAMSAAEQEIELLKGTITERNARIQKLEQARRKMERETSKLLETAKARDKSLADAGQRLLVLTKLFEKLESSLEAGKAESEKPDVRIPAPVMNTLRKHVARPRPDERKASPEVGLEAQTQPQPKTPAKIQPKAQAQTQVQVEAQPQVRLWRRELDTDDWLLGRVATQ
jgi:DNA repair exonuclease SbcCD ATPase subunit